MLRVFVKTSENEYTDEFRNKGNPSGVFNRVFQDEWTRSEIFKQIVKEIDGSEVTASGFIKTKLFGQTVPYHISGGAKALTLIALYQSDKFVMRSSFLGDNGYLNLFGQVVDIREATLGKDLKFVASHFMSIPLDTPMKGIFVQNGLTFSTYREYNEIASDLEAYS